MFESAWFYHPGQCNRIHQFAQPYNEEYLWELAGRLNADDLNGLPGHESPVVRF